jgi:hypothetical protein
MRLPELLQVPMFLLLNTTAHITHKHHTITPNTPPHPPITQPSQLTAKTATDDANEYTSPTDNHGNEYARQSGVQVCLCTFTPNTRAICTNMVN